MQVVEPADRKIQVVVVCPCHHHNSSLGNFGEALPAYEEQNVEDITHNLLHAITD